MWDPQVTFGDVLAIVVTPGIALAVWLRRMFKQAHPFTVTFPDYQDALPRSVAYQHGHHAHKTTELRVARQDLHVRVMNRYGTRLTWFAPSFGTSKRVWRGGRLVEVWTTAPKEIIEIESVHMRPNHGKEYHCDVRKDEKGLDVYVERSWAAGEPLELELTVNANAPWSGYFSFHSRNDQHDKRRATRNRVVVRPAKEPQALYPSRSKHLANRRPDTRQYEAGWRAPSPRNFSMKLHVSA